MDHHVVRDVEPGAVEHRGPEEEVEVDDVLADEVDDGAFGALPVVVGRARLVLAVVGRRGDVADGGVKPDVEVLVLLAGYPEAEVGAVPAYTPVVKPLVDPAEDLVPDLRLQPIVALEPLL